MQIGNNTAAFNTWKNYTNNVGNLRKSMSKLSSGSRINNAGDDPSGLAMSERLRTQSRNTSAAAGNVENKLNYLQTADSWMQKIHDMLGRMGELAVMANDGTKSTTDRDVLQNEFKQMQEEIVRVTGSTSKSVGSSTADANAAGKFNGIELFQGGTAISQQVGADGGQVFTSGSALDLSAEAHVAMGETGITWDVLMQTDTADASAELTALNTAKENYYASALDSVTDDTDTLNEAIAAATGDALTALEALKHEFGNGETTVASLEAWDGTGESNGVDIAGGTTGTLATQATALGSAKTAYMAKAGVSIDSVSGAGDAVGFVNAGIDFVSQKRSEVGAEMKRMEQTLDGLRSYEENITATESRIRDVDVAKETSEMSKYSILQQVGTAMLAQANQMPQGVLQLVG